MHQLNYSGSEIAQIAKVLPIYAQQKLLPVLNTSAF